MHHSDTSDTNGTPMSEEHSVPVKQAPTNRRWIMFSLASGASWFLYLHRYTWNFIRPKLEEEYGFSNLELDSLFTLFNVTYTIGQIPGGVICDMFGPHLFLVAIIVLWSLAMPLLGLGSGMGSFGAARLAFGAGQAGCYPSLAKVSREWFPRSGRTTIQGLIASFFGRGGGAMSSIILGTVLIGWLELTWRQGLVVMSLAGLVFAALFYLFYRNKPEDDPKTNQTEVDLIRAGELDSSDEPPVLPFRRVARSRSMLVFILQQFMNAGADYVYVAVMGSYFLTARGVDIGAAGIMISLPLFGGACGGVFGGIISDYLIRVTGSRRWVRTFVGFTGKTLATMFVFVAISQTEPIATAWMLFLVKFFSDWTQPTVWGTCTDMGGRYSATVFSVINTAGGIGGLVTPIVGALVLDHYRTLEIVDGVEKMVTNFSPLFTLVAAMYMISAVSWFFINCEDSLERENPAVGQALPDEVTVP
jgi:ACS family glucarate transporter-like MFS transporter